jgi:hypothetical protein
MASGLSERGGKGKGKRGKGKGERGKGGFLEPPRFWTGGNKRGNKGDSIEAWNNEPVGLVLDLRKHQDAIATLP